MTAEPAVEVDGREHISKLLVTDILHILPDEGVLLLDSGEVCVLSQQRDRMIARIPKRNDHGAVGKHLADQPEPGNVRVVLGDIPQCLRRGLAQEDDLAHVPEEELGELLIRLSVGPSLNADARIHLRPEGAPHYLLESLRTIVIHQHSIAVGALARAVGPTEPVREALPEQRTEYKG